MLFTILLVVGFLLGASVVILAIQYGRSVKTQPKAIYTIEWRWANSDLDYIVTRTQIISKNEIEAAEEFVRKIENGEITKNNNQKIGNWEILSIQKELG